MRTVCVDTLPQALIDYIMNLDPLAGEDVSILDSNGNMMAVVIRPPAYQYLLRALEQREDQLDGALNAPFEPHAKSLDDLINDSKDE
jgi:hypothetical protein